MITFGYNNKFSTALRALAAIGIGLLGVSPTLIILGLTLLGLLYAVVVLNND